MMRFGHLLALMIFPSLLIAQEALPDTSNLTLERKRILVLPYEYQEDDPRSIEMEVTEQVVVAAASLGRFEIIDRNNLPALIEEQNLVLYGLIDDSAAVALGKMATAREAILVNVLNFHQVGVPPKDDDKDEKENSSIGLAILGEIIKAMVKSPSPGKDRHVDREKHAHNIETQITAEIKLLDVETGTTLQAHTVSAGHTGGGRGKSRARALDQLQGQVRLALRNMYRLSSQVLSVQDKDVLLLLGAELGVKPGMVFTLSPPLRQRSFGSRTINIPGSPVAYVIVKDLSSDANRATIARQWSPVYAGYGASERVGLLLGTQVEIEGAVTAPVSMVRMALLARPIGRRDARIGFGMGSVKDSRNETDMLFDISARGGFRLGAPHALQLLPYAGMDAGFPFRNDDAGNMVSTVVVGFQAGLGVEVMLSPHIDLAAGLGYRFSTVGNVWQYSIEEDGESVTKPAVWYAPAPEVNISGLLFSLGLKLILP